MNPIELANEVKNRYQRYLGTTFYFKDPILRTSFEEALKSTSLCKGPFLEATPIFTRGRTPRTLISDQFGLLPDEGFLNAIQGDRSLYQHQEDAIRLVYEEQNVIVATGTGSGKTESFLYPILLHLYQEFQANELGPGVRALILYPMNALANDQRDRLGEISKRLQDGNSPFRFTFGQYIGETPEDENDTRRNARDHLSNRLNGELVFRAEMRANPPHILLTNYSMLEYLLLRPNDYRLFDDGQARWWKYLVLDEAHQYRGARGIEMAMLLRRLKRRLNEGGRFDPFRFIVTSATLAQGEKDKADVAEFATRLCGEPFEESAVIIGSLESIPEASHHKLFSIDYSIIKSIFNNGDSEYKDKLNELSKKLGVEVPGNLVKVPELIGFILQNDDRSTLLRNSILGEAVEAERLAEKVFQEIPAEDRIFELSQLVDLLIKARDPQTGAPLLSARYHLFVRSLEGVFVSYWPEKKVFIDRKGSTEQCTTFEVALCKECGQHYFVGQKDFRSGNLAVSEAIRDPSDINFGVTFFRPSEDTQNLIEPDSEESSDSSASQIYQLCVRCGNIGRNRRQCGHDEIISVIREKSNEDEDKADQIKKCSACGYQAGGRDPVREVVYGTDGPHAVIATTLHQKLPAGHKKVLAFADSRQEAAFFAWYLEDSYKDILSRNLLLKSLQHIDQYTQEGSSLKTIARNLYSQDNDKFGQESDDELTIRGNIWKAIYREFLTEEQRISLEGVGLTRWSIKWPDGIILPNILLNPPVSFSETEAWDLIYILLDSMRTDRAVELRTEPGISINWNDLGFQTFQMRYRIGSPARPRGMKYWPVRSWDGARTKRAQFLTKLLRENTSDLNAPELAVEILRSIWELFQRENTLLIPIDDARRLEPNWWRLHLVKDKDRIFQCDTCGRIQSVSIRSKCPRFGCAGKLIEQQPARLEKNHYRSMYQEELPGRLRVEEHTAQLDHDKARNFQNDFKNGKIHVLSCSTTFELGVDLGDLDTIFLRNVPPEAFNYAQRVGRAGRRERPGFAITYCRRGSHDRYHFNEPQRMMSGKVRPPVLSLKNDKIIIRHIAATTLSHFFRAHRDRFENVDNLFVDIAEPKAIDDFKAFLYQHKHELEESLDSIVPQDGEIRKQIGLDDSSWIDKIVGDNSRLKLAELEISSDYQNLRDIENNASQQRDHTKAGWAKRRSETILAEDVLSFLSRKAVIPKYGFPVDVVELDTQKSDRNQESTNISLQRDLSIAISEFAPTSKLVANKKVWTSYGLKKVIEKEWERWWYVRCGPHNRFERLPYGGEVISPPFQDWCEPRAYPRQYIEPKFGFVTGKDKPEEPKARPVRAFSTRPYFAGFREQAGRPIDYDELSLSTVSPGYMVVLCEGRGERGFYICEKCGAGFRSIKIPHKTPYDQDCHGRLDQVSLGHEFVTDVLQVQFQSIFEDNIEPIWFAYSLAYALVEGAAEVLEIPSNDLSATVAYSSGGSQIPPIILYDNVPGGAGLVARLQEKEILRECMEIAEKRVSKCTGCGETSSCYSCLRSYRNQFCHQHLQRGPVANYLKLFLGKWES